MSERKVNYDPDWQKKYPDQISTPEKAVAQIRAGQRIFIGTGCAQPQELVRALVAGSSELAECEILHLLTLGDAPYAHRELAERFSVNSFFIADNVRHVIQEGMGDYTPISLSDIPRLFGSGQLPLDAALIQVSPPDERGNCSLGISVDIVKSAAENASLVIAQVNSNMPRTMGDTTINIQDVDIVVPVDTPLLEATLPEPTDVTRQIGGHVASLIEDGSTIELGIGRIPQALLEFLKEKKDLGVHTEMITDEIVDLVKAGAITGNAKTVDRGRIVTSFCMGTRRLYDYINGNPVFSFRPTEYVNDPAVISRQNKMVAINVGLEVDLTGQVCADSLGTKFFSGIGGQADFNRGAARSDGGKAIIALASTAKEDSVSRIVSRLSPGAGVVTTRGDVQYVVTEYGVAYLHGKTIQERALALISIAHPKYRAELLHQAIEMKYIRQDHVDVEGKIHVGPTEMRTTMLMDDGTLISFRPTHPTDEPGMKDLMYNLSQQTLYYRFMRNVKHLPRKEIRNFVYVDHRNEVAIVGTLPGAAGEEIICTGRYFLNPQSNRAEVALTVKDAWQNRGIGTFLLRYLISIAKRNGIAGFTAEVLRDNKAMQAVFNKSGVKTRSTFNEGLYHYELDFV